MSWHRWSIVAIGIAMCCVQTAEGQDDLFPLSRPEDAFHFSSEIEITELPAAVGGVDPACNVPDSICDLSSVNAGLEQYPSERDDLVSRPTVTTRDDDWKITVFGALIGEIVYAEQRPIIPSAVVLLTPWLGRDTPTIDIHGKQSTFGFAIRGPEMFGMQAGGLVLTAFYGESLLDDLPGLFIPRAYGELKNDEYRFAAGVLGDVINPRLPRTLDFLNGQGSGNLGYFRGQFRAERFFHFDEETQVTVQMGLGNPITTSFSGDARTLLEDNGWPNVEGRMMLGLGPITRRGPLEFRTFELGASALVGQIRRAGRQTTIFDVWAVGADARWQLTDGIGVKGEVFHGQAIGNYNAAIIQIFNPETLQAIRTTGGWGEVYVNWSDSLHSHFGAGVDDPLDRTLSPGLRTRNFFSFANLIWNATKHLEIGAEIGRQETDYVPGADFEGLPIQNNEAMVYRLRVSLQF